MKFSKLQFYDLGGYRGPKVGATIFFPNNYGASIIQGADTYGDPKDDTYEIAVLIALKPHPKGLIGEDSEITYATDITDDVLPGQTREDVEQVLDEIAALPPRPYSETTRRRSSVD